jgi:hypothetical protein
LTCEKKVYICNKLLNTNWSQLLPSSLLIPSLLSNFDVITSSKAISALAPKTCTAVVTSTLFSNNQVEKIKKVYDEKMAHLDKQLSQEVKLHQIEARCIQYIITQLIKQKEELEEKLTKTTTLLTTIKSSVFSKPSTTKPLTPSSPTLKKPSLPNPKSNVKYILNTTTKEVLTLKSPVFIKFNQIQIENIETENLNTPTPRQGDIQQKEINKINNMDINTQMKYKC